MERKSKKDLVSSLGKRPLSFSTAVAMDAMELSKIGRRTFSGIVGVVAWLFKDRILNLCEFNCF